MPLAGSASTLSASLKAALLAGPTGAVDNEALDAFCDALSNVVIGHIVANAIVSPVGLPAPMSNTGGPVVGTGVIL
jgi:hypothetical protein